MKNFRILVTSLLFQLLLHTASDAVQDAQLIPLDPFPRSIELSKGVATVYEPQLESHKNYKEAILWAAVSYNSYDNKISSIGAIKISAKIVVDFEKRLVHVYSRNIIDSYFPEVPENKATKFTQELQANFKKETESFPLDVFLSAIADTVDRQQSPTFSEKAPRIFYSDSPAILVNIEGKELRKETAENSKLSLIINASWDLYYSEETNKYYLIYAGKWLENDSLSTKNWKPTKKRPKAFNSLPENDRFEATRKALEAAPLREEEIPKVFISHEPSELILTKGAPEYKKIADTNLYFVENTSSDLIFDHGTSSYYYLTSGRWFRSQKLIGPWSLTRDLPQTFLEIPEDHERAHVRASIPESVEAKFAVLEAQVPKTAVIDKNLKAPTVTYTGDPKFVDIEETHITRAENTEYDVFRVANKYYLCYQAVWFVGKTPNGPWKVATEVPEAIYDIPSTSPAYHVTFVFVETYTPTHVHYSYTSGYHHAYVSYGVVVYGSGYYWPPYYYDPFYYPYYYHNHWHYHHHYHPRTYGHASFYNPRTGRYVHGDFSYGPHGGSWSGERYNSRTGRKGYGKHTWDHNSSEFKGHSYSPRTGISTETKQSYKYHGNNAYDSWGNTKVQRGDQWIKSERHSTEKGRHFKFQDSKGGEGTRVVGEKGRATAYKTGSGDLYAGKNGNVYRKTTNGGWEKRENGSWKSVTQKNKLNTQQKQKLQTQRQNYQTQNRQNYQTQNRQNYQQNRSYKNSTQYRLNRDAHSRNYGNQKYRSFKQRSSFGSGSRSFNRSSGGGFRRR